MLYKLIQEYDQLFGEKTGGCLQSLDELEQLVAEIGARKFERITEIGAYRGGTTWLYSQLFGAPGCKFTIIDIKINPILYDVLERIKDKMDIDFEVIEKPSGEAP